MKIVHVIPALTKGGAERIVIELANQAAEEGHEVAIVAAVSAPADQMPTKLHPKVGVRVIHRCGTSVRKAYAHLAPWIVANRRWLLGRDIIHCHLTFASLLGAMVAGLRAASGGDKPAIVETNHAVGMAVQPWRRTLQATLLGGRDAVAFMAEDPYWQRFRKARASQLFRTIPNGIVPPQPPTASAIDRFRTEARLPHDKPIVGSIGRLLHERRPDLLLDAFAELARRYGADPHLLLGGEGPERRTLAETAQAVGLGDRVHLPGLIRDPAQLLGLVDLYLTVCVGPIAGVAALEAAFAGVPVIAVQLREGYERGSDDWIWSSTDPAEVGARAAELLADRKRLAALGQSQQAHAQANFTAAAMARAYDRLYEEALARRERANRGS